MMRRHDLDWLRVLVFMLLIFYHVGMFFVPWGFHIKNNTIINWLTIPMWFINQWRLPILFIISGMGTFYALQKRTGKQFIYERLKRLAIPLIFGMLIIIPPQVYVERLIKHEFTHNYFEFWFGHAFNGIYPIGNLSWHHLWFLPYLLLFSLVLTPVFSFLKTHTKQGYTIWLTNLISIPFGLYIFIIPLYCFEVFLEPIFPVTHALIGDWFTIMNGITLFFYGFLLISVKEVFWKAVDTFKNFYLISGIFGFSAMLLITQLYNDSVIRHFTEAFFKVFNLWSWVLALFGFSRKYLNKKNNILSYCNEAVYPFYILHQTVMLIIAYFIIDLKWYWSVKAFLMILGTFGITWVIYEYLIRRWKTVRPLFGLKNEKKSIKILRN